MNKLQELYQAQGQSPWIDNLKRSYLVHGRLAGLVSDGVRGVTSNPTIFAKAIEGSDDYDQEFVGLCQRMSVEDAYWEIVTRDITQALDVLGPLHEQSPGTDGFVSLEVGPSIAYDTESTVHAARSLHNRINRPNLLVKIPATTEGVPAIHQMISEGRSINATLIFGLERYDGVIEAYLSGLEDLAAGGGDLSGVASVASFFVSRVDTEVDRRLEDLGGVAANEALALRGRTAIAQAKLAYQLFAERFSGRRWQALVSRGARVQRPLWASTSAKNPSYPDLLYVDNLIGPDTVNTLPDTTVEAFLDHGTVARTVDQDVDGAHRVMADLVRLGVDMGDVACRLENEGVAAFAKSFDELIQQLTDKANGLDAGTSP